MSSDRIDFRRKDGIKINEKEDAYRVGVAVLLFWPYYLSVNSSSAGLQSIGPGLWGIILIKAA
jgi:hypothetical protein